MARIRNRDEVKGLILLGIIFLLILGSVLYFVISLKSSAASSAIGTDEVLRVMNVVTDDDNNIVLSSVLVYYPVSKRAVMIHIPGNTGAIYRVLGKVAGIDDVYRQKGVVPYLREVEKLLGCPIPFYYSMKLADFLHLVDMFRGLKVFIPEPLDVSPADSERILLPSGAVVLDGDKVRSYLQKSLLSDDDSEVENRMQNISAAFYTALHDHRSQLFQSNSLYKTYVSGIERNLSSDDFYKLLNLITEMDTESLVRQTVNGRIRIVDGKRLLFPFQGGELIKESVRQSTAMIVSNSALAPGRIYVLEIKNGTTVQGLAHNTSLLYQGASYDVLSAMNADRNDYEQTLIIDHIGNPEVAALVGDFIRCTNIEVERVSGEVIENNSGDVDFTIILGKDFDGRYVRQNPR